MYLMSPGRPTGVGFSWTRPAILAAGKGGGERFYFFCFHSL